MRDCLSDVVNQVSHSSDSFATGSVRVASGKADLSQGTEEQASNRTWQFVTLPACTFRLYCSVDGGRSTKRKSRRRGTRSAFVAS